jgi:proteasome beta subunit
MGLPLYDPGQDPGPSFFRYAEDAGLMSPPGAGDSYSAHATTVVAVRYVGGVVMVADRQATGSYIANRDVRKVEAADKYTAIAISGTAARGMEFIRMAQLSFEHYEKMTDATLSLEGKANYLSPIIQRNNLSTPLVVLPLLAGWDPSYQVGRIFEYDGAGGCYERLDFSTIGSGSPFADNTLRLGFRSDLDLEGALELTALALYEAGDNDPATGGPDFVRNLYPMMVTLNADGYHELATDDVAARFRSINERRTETKGLAGGNLR